MRNEDRTTICVYNIAFEFGYSKGFLNRYKSLRNKEYIRNGFFSSIIFFFVLKYRNTFCPIHFYLFVGIFSLFLLLIRSKRRVLQLNWIRNMISIFNSYVDSHSPLLYIRQKIALTLCLIYIIQWNLLSFNLPIEWNNFIHRIQFQLNDCHSKCLNSCNFSIYIQKKFHVQFVYIQMTHWNRARSLFIFTMSVRVSFSFLSFTLNWFQF